MWSGCGGGSTACAQYAGKLVGARFLRCRAVPTAFVPQVAGMRLVVWRDDFTFLGRDRDLHKMAKLMGEWSEIKVRAILGQEPGEDKDVRIFSRIITCRTGHSAYEGDDKHTKPILDELGLQGISKVVDTLLP